MQQYIKVIQLFTNLQNDKKTKQNKKNIPKIKINNNKKRKKKTKKKLPAFLVFTLNNHPIPSFSFPASGVPLSSHQLPVCDFKLYDL